MVSPTTSAAPPRSATGGQIRRRVAESVAAGGGGRKPGTTGSGMSVDAVDAGGSVDALALALLIHAR